MNSGRGVESSRERQATSRHTVVCVRNVIWHGKRAKELSESTGAPSISLDNESVKRSVVFSTISRWTFFSFFSSLFRVSSFSVCFAESVSPILFRRFPRDSGNVPVNQTTFQSTSRLSSQPVSSPVNPSNSQSISQLFSQAVKFILLILVPAHLVPSPGSQPVHFPVHQSTFQSTSRLSSQPVNFPVNPSNSQSIRQMSVIQLHSQSNRQIP